MAASRQFGTTVEYPDVIEPEEASREDVSTLWIFPIDPPVEIRHQALKGSFKEPNIGAAQFPFNVEQQQSRPGVDWRIHVAEVPFVGGYLAVWMRVQTSKHQQELVLCKIEVHQ